MVYAAIGDEFEHGLHAVNIEARTPEEEAGKGQK